MRMATQATLCFVVTCFLGSGGFAGTKSSETWQNWNVQSCLARYRPSELLNSYTHESLRIKGLISATEAKSPPNLPLAKMFDEFNRQYSEWENEYLHQVAFLVATARACYNAEGECLCGSNQATIDVPRSLERHGFSRSESNSLFRLLGLDNDRDMSSGSPQDARCVFANAGLNGEQIEELLRRANQNSPKLWNILKERQAQLICNRIQSEEENWLIVTVIRKSFDMGNSDRFQTQQRFYEFKAKYIELLKNAANLEGVNEQLSFSP